MADDVEMVLDAGARIGESPTWFAPQQALYWIDVHGPALHRLDPATGEQRRWPVSADIGAYALHPSGAAALVALRTGLHWLDLATAGLTLVATPPFDPALFRFNDGVCDSAGRFWVGVMFDPREPSSPSRAGPMHRYTAAEGLRPTADEAALHNGLALNPEETVLYVTHSNAQTIHAYDYDIATGRTSGRRVFAEVAVFDGLPDGATVDRAGGYWCALHGGGRLRRYHPDGRHDRDVALPVSQPTMCVFGGPGLDTLYVTSASEGLDAEQRRAEPLAGALLSLRPGIGGAPRPCTIDPG